MQKLLIRNGDDKNPRIGIDWRAVAALGSLLVLLGTGFSSLLIERFSFSEHMKNDRPTNAEWDEHRFNQTSARHLSTEEYKVMLERTVVLKQILWRLDGLDDGQGIIMDALGIKLPKTRSSKTGVGADVVPPGQDD